MRSALGVFLLLSVIVVALSIAVEDQEFGLENLDVDERELHISDEGNAAALFDQPSVGKRSYCARVCVNFLIFGGCLRWGTRCRRNEIPSQPIQLPSNDVENAALNQLESQPSDEIATTRRGQVCILCAGVWVFKVCPVCLRWDKQRSADVDDVGTSNDVVLVSAEEQKAAVAVLEGESQTAFRKLYDEKVIKAEKYEFPARLLGKGVTDEKSIDGVLVTLADDRRFFVIHGRELWRGKSTAVLRADVMAEVWRMVQSKDVQSSTVADYVTASDSSISSKQAAEKMMALN